MIFVLVVGGCACWSPYVSPGSTRKRSYTLSCIRREEEQGGSNDNRDIAAEVAKLRAERAQLLGYPNHAAYQLETRMAKTPEAAEDFLKQVWELAAKRSPVFADEVRCGLKAHVC